MNRRRLESAATYLAIILLGLLLLTCIAAVADGIFDWDVLPPLLDKVAILLMTSIALLLGGCVLVSVLLNLSIAAQKLSVIAERGDRP